MWPVTGFMVNNLEKRFHHREQDPEQPVHLDRNVQSTPSLALDAMGMELRSMRSMALTAARDALTYESGSTVELQDVHRRLEGLNVAIGEFASGIHRHDRDPLLSATLPHGLRISQYLVNIAEQAAEYRRARSRAEIEHSTIAESLNKLVSDALALLERAELDPAQQDFDELTERLKRFEERYQQVKASLLRAGTMRDVPSSRMAHALEQLSALHRIIDQAGKAARYLRDFESRPSDEQPEDETSDTSKETSTK